MRAALQSRKAQEQRAYLARLQEERLQEWDEVTGQSYAPDVDPEYWQERDHSYSASPVATVKPDDRDASVKPELKVSAVKSFAHDMHARRNRRAVMNAARSAEVARVQGCKDAAVALGAFLTSPEEDSLPLLTWNLLHALWVNQEQERREYESLMSRMPYDGRPPVVAPRGSLKGEIVNGQEVRGSERWVATPAAVQECRWLLTVPINRFAAPRWRAEHEWNAAVDRGAVVNVMSPVAPKNYSRSRSSAKVQPILKPKVKRRASYL